MDKHDDFGFLSAPAQRALESAGIRSMEDCAKIGRKELLELHGFGPDGMKKLEAKMAEAKIQFKMK